MNRLAILALTLLLAACGGNEKECYLATRAYTDEMQRPNNPADNEAMYRAMEWVRVACKK